MKHLTIGIFGENELIKRLAKQGTVNDIAIYNHASSEGVFTYISPNSEKLSPLLQAINIIDVPVLAGQITKELAEQIVAIDAFGFEKGFVLNEEIKSIAKNTCIENFSVVDEKELREKVKEIESMPIAKSAWIPIDNYFDVKSVGTVILSVIKGGSVKKHDKLFVQPLNKEVVVKGIQSQDRDMEEASAGMRIGLNLKGVEAGELKRGYVICKEANVSKAVSLEFSKSKFSKEDISSGSSILLSVGLQVVSAKAESIEDKKINFSLEQPVAFFSGQKCLLASTKQDMPRIIGGGVLI